MHLVKSNPIINIISVKFISLLGWPSMATSNLLIDIGKNINSWTETIAAAFKPTKVEIAIIFRHTWCIMQHKANAGTHHRY